MSVNDGDDSRHLGGVQQSQFSLLSKPAHIESAHRPHDADCAMHMTCSLQYTAADQQPSAIAFAWVRKLESHMPTDCAC